jgi:hypothetical protein
VQQWPLPKTPQANESHCSLLVHAAPAASPPPVEVPPVVVALPVVPPLEVDVPPSLLPTFIVLEQAAAKASAQTRLVVRDQLTVVLLARERRPRG